MGSTEKWCSSKNKNLLHENLFTEIARLLLVWSYFKVPCGRHISIVGNQGFKGISIHFSLLISYDLYLLLRFPTLAVDVPYFENPDLTCIIIAGYEKPSGR